MKIIKPMITAVLTSIVAIAQIPNAAMAQAVVSYTGNWPVTANLPPQFGNTACLKLVDNGSAGSPHSGSVTSSGDLTGSLSGTFQVVNRLLVVNLQTGSSNGELVFVQFIAPASNGDIGNGVYNDAGLFPAASYALTFGKKGSC